MYSIYQPPIVVPYLKVHYLLCSVVVHGYGDAMTADGRRRHAAHPFIRKVVLLWFWVFLLYNPTWLEIWYKIHNRSNHYFFRFLSRVNGICMKFHIVWSFIWEVSSCGTIVGGPDKNFRPRFFALLWRSGAVACFYQEKIKKVATVGQVVPNFWIFSAINHPLMTISYTPPVG